MGSLLRLARVDDADAVRRIYAPFVSGTAVSFEVEPPDSDEIRVRILTTLEILPWLVCERDGAVIGYAYASPHRIRAAYGWSVDVTVYVHASCRRQGVGRALYTSLLELLTQQGYYNACAGITLPNESSVRLHEAVGFEPVGVYRAIGYKAGAWHDVGWWQLDLADIGGVLRTPEGAAALDAGSLYLK